MELNYHIALRFDRFAIDQRGLIAPLVKSLSDGRDQVRGTENWPDALDGSVFCNCRHYANGVRAVDDWTPRGVWISMRDQIADLHFFVAIERPSSLRCGDANGALNAHCDGRRRKSALAGQIEKDGAIAG